MQPFLGTIRPILIVSDIRLEIIYLVVGSSKLIRKFLSGLSCLLDACLSAGSRLANQSKNGIAGPVHYIGFGIFFFRSIRNNGSPIRNIASHGTLLTRPVSQDISASNPELMQFDPLWIKLRERRCVLFGQRRWTSSKKHFA
jgi:hypothetical protein